jgi:UDP-N-acetylglucosamine--N-acetylmuramyl-(pentapeptide) pyrophosphoryl-undecaprenol N-acetylglucosamine transferase
MGIPVVLHEQNAAAGLTNRILSHFAKKVLMGFSGAFKGGKAVLVGNPVREQLLCLPEKHISPANEALKVLVIGGSLGAQVLNKLLPKVLSHFETTQFKVLHQSGKGHDRDLKLAYQKLNLEVDVQVFIKDMDAAYNWADLVICRAGALTVAEVAVAGLPAIFVPLPHAVDDHQTKNAQDLVEKRAAVLIPQNELNEDKLSDYLQTFRQNRALLEKMSKNSKKAAIIDATERVASVCNQFV